MFYIISKEPKVNRKIILYMMYTHSQNDSGDLRGVAGGDGELGCLCGKAGTRQSYV